MTMATDRQVEANRLNALKSTGPKSDEGKSRSRANSYKHGMASEMTGAEAKQNEAFAERLAKWSDIYHPLGEDGEWALERAVAASFQIERCERAFNSVVAGLAERAASAWDLDRRLEAATLAAKLARDPLCVARRLETTKHGCDVMRTLWSGLGDSLEAKGEWTESQRSLALDLLGIPIDFREGPTPLEPTDGCDLITHRLSVVIEECERLNATQLEILGPLDELQQRQAEAGDIGVLSRPAQLVLRYEREAWRRYRESIRAVRETSTGESLPSAPVPSAPTHVEKPPVKEPEAPAKPLAAWTNTDPKKMSIEVYDELGPEVLKGNDKLFASCVTPFEQSTGVSYVNFREGRST